MLEGLAIVKDRAFVSISAIRDTDTFEKVAETNCCQSICTLEKGNYLPYPILIPYALSKSR